MDIEAANRRAGYRGRCGLPRRLPALEVLKMEGRKKGVGVILGLGWVGWVCVRKVTSSVEIEL
jgi:hypothetical protein